jgi:hypothetical protein
VVGSTRRDELRIGEEGLPRPADDAEAAEILGRKSQQDLRAARRTWVPVLERRLDDDTATMPVWDQSKLVVPKW